MRGTSDSEQNRAFQKPSPENLADQDGRIHLSTIQLIATIYTMSTHTQLYVILAYSSLLVYVHTYVDVGKLTWEFIGADSLC